MSFSSRTKTELARLALHSKIEALLELSAMARLNGTLVLNRNGTQLRFMSEHEDVIYRVVSTARFLYEVNIEIRSQQNEQLQQKPVFFADLPDVQMEELLRQGGIDLFGNTTESRDRILGRLSSENNARSYLRGAFMAAGSVTNPEKSYHLEIVSKNALDDEILRYVISVLQLTAKQTMRGENYVVYLKDSEAISDFLVAIGATQAMLTLENVKVEKELRNAINRKSNAEAANLDKQYRASLAQMKAIHWIQRRKGLSSLPESLQDLARARLAHPMANMRELGEMMNPPIGKSGVVHRMRRLMAMVEERKEV